MQRTFFAPELSATTRFVSSWIMCVTPSSDAYFAFSTISTSRHRFVLLSGRVSMIFTMSPTPASRFSSCAMSLRGAPEILLVDRMRHPALDGDDDALFHLVADDFADADFPARRARGRGGLLRLLRS